MLLGVLTACNVSNDGNDPDNTLSSDVQQPGDDETKTNKDEETEKELVPEDFDGVDFNILVRKNRFRYLHAEEDSTDRVASAAWKRNKKLEEMYNIDINVKEMEDTPAKWVTALQTSQGDYDLCMAEYWFYLDMEGLLTNILELDEINPDDDYWYQGWNDQITVNNKLYTITGDVTNEMVEQIEVIYFNKQMADRIQEDLYDYVDKGTWTLEQMDIISKKVAAGLDTAETSDDVYGIMYDRNSVNTALLTLGINLVERTDNGFFKIVEDHTSNIAMSEALTEFIHQNYVDYSNKSCLARDRSNFINGKSLMYATSLRVGELMKPTIEDNDWDYGIVITPKFEEEDEYVSTVYGCTPLAIPNTARSTHVSAVILDAMNFMGEETTVHSFYEVVILGQMADLADDVRMIEMARSLITTNIAFIYDAGVIQIHNDYLNAVVNDKPFGSSLATHLDVARSGLDTIMEKYQ